MINVFDEFIGRDFLYGDSDCCQFVGRWVEAMTGKNPAKDFHYTDERQAYDIIAEHGGFEGLMTHIFGEPIDDPQDGDIALVARPELVGIVYRGRIVARTQTDLNDIALSRAKRFWKCRS